jgi:hypothetical protein
MNLLRGKLELDRMYQKEFAIHTKVVNRQQEVIGLMEASVVDLKKTLLAQNKFIARKHGREHTGRRRGRPKKLVGLDGTQPAGGFDSQKSHCVTNIWMATNCSMIVGLMRSLRSG